MTGREDPQSLHNRIVDTAIDLAEQEGWEELRLRKVAERCGVPLTDVLSEFRDIDAVANAWFERALAAMLQPPEPGFQGRPAGERVHTVMMRWFDATAAHRRERRRHVECLTGLDAFVDPPGARERPARTRL